MANEVYEALGIWASIPTWHTGHGTDERRFDEAIAELDATVASVTLGKSGQLSGGIEKNRRKFSVARQPTERWTNSRSG